MAVGFIDGTCPATTVYSAYNVLPEPKTMMPFPLMGHSQSPDYSRAKEKFIMEVGHGTAPEG